MSWRGLALNMAASTAALVVCLLALWRIAVRMRDVSIIDIFWGPGFAIVGLVTLLAGDGPVARRVLLCALTALWGLRLGGYLWWRNHGKGEDARYAAMRGHIGETTFHRWALVHVYLMQGVVLFIVSLPVQVGGQLTRHELFTPVVWFGLAIYAIGLTFEATGDAQLARFKSDPATAGQVMDRGLWRYTRHPNYFGDACVWWGIWLTVCVHWAGALSVFAPAVMTLFLVRVTGKRLLERRMSRTRPGYSDYVASTSGFFPLPPRRRTA